MVEVTRAGVTPAVEAKVVAETGADLREVVAGVAVTTVALLVEEATVGGNGRAHLGTLRMSRRIGPPPHTTGT